MDTGVRAEPLMPGETAPDFVLPAITGDGEVRLADFLRRSPVLVGLFRGVYCAFCRRHIAALEQVARKLRDDGIETLAIVTSSVERARLYFRFRRTELTLASDPEMSVHAAFRLPRYQMTKGPTQWPSAINLEEAGAIRVNFADELPEPVPLTELGHALDRKDRFTYERGDDKDAEASWNQLGGLFLLDPSGMVRWRQVEAENGPAALAAVPSSAEIQAAAAGLTR